MLGEVLDHVVAFGLAEGCQGGRWHRGRPEAAGLLARETSSADGRVVRLCLTVEGERRLAATVTALGTDRRRLVELVSELGEDVGAGRSG